MVILDANIILRYLLNDQPDMAEKAETYLLRGDAVVTTEVIAEVIYVLKGVYSLERTKIADTVRTFMDLAECRDVDVIGSALDLYAEQNLDFVDCVLYGYHKVRGAEIATFDRKLSRLTAESITKANPSDDVAVRG